MKTLPLWKFFSQAPGALKLAVVIQLALLAILIYRNTLEFSSMTELVSLIENLRGSSNAENGKAIVVAIVDISNKKNWLMITEFICLLSLWAVTGRLIRNSIFKEDQTGG